MTAALSISALRQLGREGGTKYATAPGKFRPRKRRDQAKPIFTAAPDPSLEALLENIAGALGLTTGRITASRIAGTEPLFVRVFDLHPLAGIKRGFAYRRINGGTFKSITLREPGKKLGVRLVYWPGVKNWLLSRLAQQNPDNA